MLLFEFNIINLIDSIALVQGTFVGIILLLRRNNILPSVLMGLFLIFNCIELLPTILIEANLIVNDLRMLLIPLNFYYLSLQLLYLYTRSIISDINWNKSFYHLIPGIMEFIIMSLLYIFLPDYIFQKDNSDPVYIGLTIYFLIGGAYSIVYSIMIIRIAHKHKNKILNYISSTENYLLTWVERGTIAYLILLVVIGISLLALDSLKGGMALFVSLFNASIIFWFSYYAIMQRHIRMYKSSDVEEQNTALKEQELDNQDVIDGNETENFTLIEVNQYIENSKCYLRTNLTIFEVANGIDISIKELSQIINREAKVNFNIYINRFRIEKSKLLLVDPEHSKLSIEGIGLEVGFRSKSAFYRSFKQLEGITPGQYFPNR